MGEIAESIDYVRPMYGIYLLFYGRPLRDLGEPGRGPVEKYTNKIEDLRRRAAYKLTSILLCIWRLITTVCEIVIIIYYPRLSRWQHLRSDEKLKKENAVQGLSVS